MRCRVIVFLCGALAVGPALAAASQSPIPSPAAPPRPAPRTPAVPERTFYKDVLPILQVHCQECHRPPDQRRGSFVAPMAFMSYGDVRPWAQAIARKVEAREMPPWRASEHTRGVFENERRLDEAQIATIVQWVREGARAGSPADAPPTPESRVSANGWRLGEPDVTIVGEPNWIAEDSADDLTQNEVGAIPEDMWVQGVEFKAGSPIVHHICASVILPPDTPGPDRETSLGCAASGADARMLPPGYAFLLPKDAMIRLEVHSHKRKGPGTGVWDRSALGLTLSRTPVRHRVRFNPISNTTFEIPPGHSSWAVGAGQLFERDTTILALWPHGHVRAVSARYQAIYPDGKTELLLDVPKFDQDWQVVYYYREPKQIPAGTRIETQYRYDNSAARAARRGFDSEQTVRFGPRASDEMNLGFIAYADTTPSTDPKIVPPDRISSQVKPPQRDAVDRDLWWRDTAKYPGTLPIQVDYSRVGPGDVIRPIDQMGVDSVVSYNGSAAMRLRTEVSLDFGGVAVPTGNGASNTAGVYGLWLKKASNGWRLVLTGEPDVWGTQFNPATAVAELPLSHEQVSQASTAAGTTDRFNAVLETRDAGGRLVLSWGPHRWTADFTVGK